MLGLGQSTNIIKFINSFILNCHPHYSHPCSYPKALRGIPLWEPTSLPELRVTFGGLDLEYRSGDITQSLVQIWWQHTTKVLTFFVTKPTLPHLPKCDEQSSSGRAGLWWWLTPLGLGQARRDCSWEESWTEEQRKHVGWLNQQRDFCGVFLRLTVCEYILWIEIF